MGCDFDLWNRYCSWPPSLELPILTYYIDLRGTRIYCAIAEPWQKQFVEVGEDLPWYLSGYRFIRVASHRIGSWGLQQEQEFHCCSFLEAGGTVKVQLIKPLLWHPFVQQGFTPLNVPHTFPSHQLKTKCLSLWWLHSIRDPLFPGKKDYLIQQLSTGGSGPLEGGVKQPFHRGCLRPSESMDIYNTIYSSSKITAMT